ncbi:MULTISPECIES: succinate dehydrogenase, cytochrome b556 subunit [Limnobacter]|uniref:Succinate dehydrogenase cytochrome b556 subunit n=1 Tax=Limnobacter litoralis TaxID=481366 RepID=A0ABQ5YRB5_9BURK|nr:MULTISPECIES: succinate dehydrogenase, cytochrome b556 subunit [Limnobacter]GLR26622.1 succinate dehydrogenase, cytochrome b556 subunit [Limnobacter litoralis]HEX5484963.1 succinate dehydrogenase, cytochrome b556 subunit [Limnobacter sp.]
MSNTVTKKRPEYRNIHVTQILKYRLPLAGKLSILHRVSGAILFLALPVVLLPLFDKSLTSELSFQDMQGLVSNPLVKIVLLGLIWSYMHHFCAGIRYLMLDAHMGTDKYAAQKSAGVVFAVSLSLTALFGLKLFGVF